MLPKRTTRIDSHSSFTASERNLILAAETLRSGEIAAPAAPAAAPAAKAEEKISVFWRVFGGTILSIAALVFINAYQSLAANIHELRGDLSRLRESAGDFIKKDDFNTRQATVWTSVRDAHALAAPVTVLTSKIAALEQQAAAADKERRDLQATLGQLAALDKQLKDAEAERRELSRELQAFRERLAKFEGLHAGKKGD